MKKTNNNELFAPEAYSAPTAKVYMVQLRHSLLQDSTGEQFDTTTDIEGAWS